MKRELLKNRLMMTVMGVLLLSVFGVSAQDCDAGRTDFNTSTPLGTSTTNVSNGIIELNEDCGIAMSVRVPPHHNGQVLTPDLVTVALNANNFPAGMNVTGAIFPGFGAIVSNPRNLHSYFMNVPGNNIYVNMRSGTMPFFEYTITGLAPGSRVTFEATVYNLIDPSAVPNNFFGVNGTFDMQVTLLAREDPSTVEEEWFGFNALGGNVNNHFPVIPDVKRTTIPIPNNDVNGIAIALDTIVPASGAITFFMARTSGCWKLPVGVDGVKINGVPRPPVTFQYDQCKLEPVVFEIVCPYPEGTTFEWVETITGSIGSDKGFTFTPPTHGNYNVVVTVTKPGCQGAKSDVLELIFRQVPTVDKPKDQTLCYNENTDPVNFTGNIPSGVIYNWTNSQPSIGLAASGTGNILPFTTTNSGITPVTATITVTPTSNGCVGDPETFTITVNPVPTVNKPPNQTGCNGKSTTAVNFTGNMSSGVTYKWTNSHPSIGLAASGSENIPAFNAINTGTSTVTATITVTPKTDDCIGDEVTFTITIDPPANAPEIKSYITCPEKNPTTITWTSLVTGATPGGTLNWYNSATGGSPIPDPGSFDATLTQTQSYWVSETINGCESLRGEVVVKISDEPQAPLVVPHDDCELVPGAPKTWASLVTTAGNFTWYSADNDGSKLASEPAAFHTGTAMPKTTYYVIVTDVLGCESRRTPVYAQVLPNPTTPPNGEVIYYRGDIQPDNKFKNVLAQKPGVVTPDAGATIYWWDESVSEWITTPPTPPTPDPSDFTNKTYSYRVKQIFGATGCESQEATITVKIYLTPPPKVRDIIYCAGETTIQLNKPVVEIDATGYVESDLELRWYNSNNPSDNTPFTVSPNNPTPSSATTGKKEYWVSQYNKITDAESERVLLTVTVYANPEFNVIKPAPECAPETVNITINNSATGNVWQITNNTNSFPESATYYDDAGGLYVLPNPAAISAVGKRDYYIRVAFTTPEVTAAGNNYCYSVIKPVEVDIRSLDKPTITAKDTICPNTSTPLVANVVGSSNIGVITYSWVGTNGLTGSTSTIPTGNLPGVARDEYKFTVTVGDGVCKDKISDVHTITIGDAPVIGVMKISEPGSTNQTVTFNPTAPKLFYSCGNALVIDVTDYVSVVTDYTPVVTDFEWRDSNGALVHKGRLFPVPASPDGVTTYKLNYTNKCPASVDVTIHSIPLDVSSSFTPSMTLCEDDTFEAILNITCSEYPTNTNIEWKHDGNTLHGHNSATYKIAAAKPTDSGLYSYTVTNRGCIVTGDIAGGTQLNVSDKVIPGLLPIDSVCAGGEITIGLGWVTPSATVLEWNDPDGTIQGSTSGLTVKAIPPFRHGSGHRYTYTYIIDATYVYCSIKIPVQVYVDEPLNGAIAARSPICEGESTRINAGLYNAETYIWTSTAFNGEKYGVEIVEAPEETSTYYLNIFRGACSAEDDITIEVKSKPRIQAIDSLDVRDREVIFVQGYGTPPFKYSIDGKPADENPVKYNLTFSRHSFQITDDADCSSDIMYIFVEPPKLFPPPYFSPNGDGVNDTWEVPLMRHVYPNAIVTIYDRFGKEIAKYTGAGMGWDGKYNGRDMPSTDYWYVIEVKEVERTYTGHFTLLRR